MGLGNQMRDDHPPFTITRKDQIEFLKAREQDALANPETINEKMNLLWVEERAYGWALREPSMIPVWMHPRLGLPDKGIKPSDDIPWYRKGAPRRSAAAIGRPQPQQLPDYLQQAQDEINRLLEKYSAQLLTDEESTTLG